MKGRSDPKDPMALIEAALYVSGRPLEISALSKLVGRPEGEVRGIIERLMERYDSLGSPIQILRLSNDRYAMQLRPEYVEHVRRFSNKRLLTLGPLRSLSFIAMKQPVTQAYLVKVRGKLAYQHVKKLKEMELVEEERMGRTKILRTTKMFSDMFNLSYDLPTLKRQLRALLGEGMAQGGKGIKEKVLNPTCQTPGSGLPYVDVARRPPQEEEERRKEEAVPRQEGVREGGTPVRDPHRGEEGGEEEDEGRRH